jgi:hypothetical protein
VSGEGRKSKAACGLSLGEDNDCFWRDTEDAALATPIRRCGYG